MSINLSRSFLLSPPRKQLHWSRTGRLARHASCWLLLLSLLFISTPSVNAWSSQETTAQTEGGEQAAANAADETDESDAESDEATTEDDKVDEILAGHSAHGEAFNEGPRQEAYLMEGTGRVSFPVTTQSEKAQAFIDQGVGQLHGFWYLEAERSFRQAIQLDPDCAIAYWGCAQANKNNDERARGFIEDAMEHLEGTTERERRYIESYSKYLNNTDPKRKRKRAEDYTKALEDLVIDFPEDLEAKAFLALQIWLNRSSDLPIGSYLAADALMDQIFEQEPLHPTHHFRIHLWDTRRAEMALESAAKCGPSAPSIAHMWHMPGHIYSRLHRYEDAVWQQEASARVDHAHMIRDRVMPDEIHNFAHNNEWLIRNLIFIGRVQDGIDLAKNMVSLPRHPKYNTLSQRGSSRYGRERLIDVVTQYERWEEAVDLCYGPYLEPTDSQDEQLNRYRLLGAALWMTERSEQAEKLVAELQQKREEFVATRESKIESAREKALEKFKPKEESAEIDEATQKKIDDAVADAEKSFDRELKGFEQALQEIEGFRLLSLNQFKEAHEALKEAKYSNRLLLNEVRFLAGGQDEAIEEAAVIVERNKNEVLPLARQVYLLHAAGKVDETKAAFEQLRSLSSSIDMQSELFTRLNPIAKELGYEGDWRADRKLADDVGTRFDLADLGPFRWTPSLAPDWSLPKSDGSQFNSKELAGQPTILIFYLGFGCLHCAEQLHAFAPEMEKFEEAGIRLMAISSDDLAGLQKSIEDYDQGLPIPLVSDAEQVVFRKFRAFDDFEGAPLHGTFLIDGEGKIRWQDISYEPFMDHQFLLEEAQRLLAQSAPQFVSHESTVDEKIQEVEVIQQEEQKQEVKPAEVVTPALPEPPSSAPADMPLVYATSFELGAAAWSPTDETAWNVKETPQGHVYSQFKKRSEYEPPHRSPYNISLLKDHVVTDFELNVDVLSTHEDYGHRDVCLFFGYQDPAHFYYVHLGKEADPHANQIFIVNGADRTKISLTSTEGTNWDEAWHHVRIKRNVESGEIAVYFDDLNEPVMTAKDTTFTWGLVGLGSFDDTGDWDDFVLEGRVGGEGMKPE